MSINVPGVGLVPVIFMPASDEDYRDQSEGGRSGFQPIAVCHHRIVGSLNSADLTFAANDANPATVGSPGRPVSANFAIGYDSDGKLYAHQYVDISDTAYCNGDCRAITHPDQPSRWDTWYGHRGHNERTVSIEHDDQGGSSDPTKKGIVREPIIATSIALDRLMLTGNLAAIRAAGIRCRDPATATALGKIVPGTKTLIHHNDIAGANKPYCWRPWQADKVGFPRARYIAELSAAPTPTPEVDVPVPSDYSIVGQVATVKAGKNVRTGPKLTAPVIRQTAAVETWTVTCWSAGDVDPDGGTGRWLVRWNAGKWEYTSEANVASGPAAPVPPPPDCTAEVLAARQAQYDADLAAANVDPVLIGARP